MYKEELEKATNDTIIKYKEIIFGVDIPTYIECLDELLRQQVLHKKVSYQKLLNDAVRRLAWKQFQENTVVNGDMLIDKKTGAVLDPELDYICYKEKF